jgi:type IV pilus assembly protein PilY1
LSNTSAASYAGSQQSLYGIWDWNLAAWNLKSTVQYSALPYNGTLAPTASLSGTGSLQVQTFTDVSSGGVDYRTVTANTICWAGATGCTSGQYGWYLNLDYGHSNPNDVNLPSQTMFTANPTIYEQVTYSPILDDGAFIVNTTIPPSASLTNCFSTVAGGYTMAINPASGGAFPNSVFGANGTYTQLNGQSVSGIGQSGTGSAFLVTTGNGTGLLSFLGTQTVGGTPTAEQVNLQGNSMGGRLTWIQRR